ncbi:WAT1-related protein At2g39510-like isoform X2 [Anopheles sinensis]|uniref:WAT1-related protein At2g39510-like isoform X2 n=1 Tax=Anopheles sinensis TaxID=74873 RepID=A0A084WR65_ANOSI|nr:WAT1-related protein At2g39510-like isoform X2 [Anopheles sinensis]
MPPQIFREPFRLSDSLKHRVSIHTGKLNSFPGMLQPRAWECVVMERLPRNWLIDCGVKFSRISATGLTKFVSHV